MDEGDELPRQAHVTRDDARAQRARAAQAQMLGAGLGMQCARTAGRQLRLSLTGELDLASTQKLEHRLADARAAADRVAVDLAGITFIDSSGLALLLRLTANARRDGWDLVLVSPSRPVRQLVELTGTAAALALED